MSGVNAASEALIAASDARSTSVRKSLAAFAVRVSGSRRPSTRIPTTSSTAACAAASSVSRFTGGAYIRVARKLGLGRPRTGDRDGVDVLAAVTAALVRGRRDRPARVDLERRNGRDGARRGRAAP